MEHETRDYRRIYPQINLHKFYKTCTKKCYNNKINCLIFEDEFMRNRAVITILTLILTLGCCVFLFCSCGESGTSGEIHHTQDGKVIIRVSMFRTINDVLAKGR